MIYIILVLSIALIIIAAFKLNKYEKHKQKSGILSVLVLFLVIPVTFFVILFAALDIDKDSYLDGIIYKNKNGEEIIFRYYFAPAWSRPDWFINSDVKLNKSKQDSLFNVLNLSSWPLREKPVIKYLFLNNDTFKLSHYKISIDEEYEKFNSYNVN